MKIILTAILLFNFLSLDSYSETILAKVGKEKITLEQLSKAYGKNLRSDEKRLTELDKDSLLSFVELYVDYRLKVLDAIDKGYLQDSSVKEEIKSNRRLLAESFYYENELMKPKINDIVERRKVEYRFAFIIVPFETQDSSSRSEKRAKAQMALDSIKSGMPFKEAAIKYSEDARTKNDGGEVDTWVTGGSIQKPLEDIFYSLEPGEVYDEVLETPYGCFVLKLLEREKRDLINLSIITIAGNNDLAESRDSSQYIKTADSLIAMLDAGIDFGKLARENSKDPVTAQNDGKYNPDYSRSTGFIGTGAPLDPAIAEAAFDLKEGVHSDKIFSDLGLHIVKINEKKDINLKEEYDAAKDVYKKVFYQKDKKAFMDSVANHFGFEMNDQNIAKFQEELDTNKTTIGEAWAEDVSTDTKGLELFKFNGDSYSINDFIKNTVTRKELRGYSLTDQGIKEASRKIIDDDLFDLATKGLEEKYPEYQDLLNEFRDGIILFKAEDEEVWSKNKLDDDIAKAFWDSTKANYVTNYRFDITEIYRLNETSIKEIKEELDNGAKIDELAELKTQRDGMREKKGRIGWIEKTKNTTADNIPIEEVEKGALIGPFKNKFGWSIVKIHDFEKPREMTYEEAKSYITPYVQNIVQSNLRDSWLNRIKEKHPVKIYEDRIEKMTKEN